MPATVSFGNTITLSSVVAEHGPFKPLVAVDSTMTVQQACEFLIANAEVSAPVENKEAGVFIGLVNMIDIFHYVGFNTVDAAKLNEPIVNVLAADPDALNLWKFDVSDKLAKVMVAFRKGIHRVLVIDETHATQPAVLLSQSDVIKFLNNHTELVDSSESIAKGLGFVATEANAMVTVNVTTTAAAAFTLLAESEITAAPIVNEEGTIVGTISASDLRGVAVGTDLAGETVVQFLEERHARGSGAPVSVHNDATIGEIMIPLAFSGVHRVWVVDAKKKPVGVVSMSDVIERVCKSAGL